MKTNNRRIRRGEIYYADLSPIVGSEQGGIRPVLVIQNDVGNKYSPTVIVAPITSRMNKPRLPTHVWIGNLPYVWKDSLVLTEQVRTIDKSRLQNRIMKLNKKKMNRVDRALKISFGIMVNEHHLTPGPKNDEEEYQ